MLENAQSISVLTVCSSEKGFDFFRSFFTSEGISDVTYALSADAAKRDLLQGCFDVVVVNSPLADEPGTELAIDTARYSSAGVILLVKRDVYDRVAAQSEDSGVYTVSKPVQPAALHKALHLVLATNARLKRSEKKAATIVSKVEEIRKMNRAKWLLIENLGLSEADAHRAIEKQAMNTRCSISEVSDSIIRTYGTRR